MQNDVFRIFIGWDSRFPLPAAVLADSIVKLASVPVAITYLNLKTLQEEIGFNRPHDPLQSTEFTYTRFLVPYLCNFEGTALFLDNDMLCLTDIAELANLPMDGYTLRVVKHDHNVVDGSIKMYGAVQTAYPRKNWSSMMLMDCSRLRLWSKQYVEQQTGACLHRFQDLSDAVIGELPAGWNELDRMDANTKLIHWTSGGPWYEQYKDCPHADVWRAARDEYLKVQHITRENTEQAAAGQQ